MKITQYLIQSNYGWKGEHDGQEYEINSEGLNVWNIPNDGTIESLEKGFREAQDTSSHVAKFNAIADEHGFPRHLGLWKAFSVIDKFDDREQQVNVVVPEGMSEEELERFCAFKVWSDRRKNET